MTRLSVNILRHLHIVADDARAASTRCHRAATGALGFDEIVRWCLDGSLPLCMMLILPVAWILWNIPVSLMGKRGSRY